MLTTLSPESLARLPKADLIQFVIALAQPVPAPVDADVAPTPEPKAPAKKAKKAEREVPCNVHALDVCDRKFWRDTGANDERHVPRLSA